MLYTRLVIPVTVAALANPIVRTYSLFMTPSMKPNTCSTRQRVLDFSRNSTSATPLFTSFLRNCHIVFASGTLSPFDRSRKRRNDSLTDFPSWIVAVAAPLRQTMSGFLSLYISAWLFFLNYSHITGKYHLIV